MREIDYYPFGMLMPGRSHNADGQRYGFHGMEKDDEVKGEGNSYDFGARMYDPRVGRWLSRDALAQKKPYLSPYQAMRNNPLMFGDPDGNDEYLKIVINVQGNDKPIVIESSEAIRKNVYMAGEIHKGGDKRMAPTQILYDYTVTVTVNVDKDGKIIGAPTESRGRHKDGGLRHYDSFWMWFGTGWNKGEIADLNSSYNQPGGFYMTGSDGMGTIFTSKNPPKYIGNIDDLRLAINTVNRLNQFSKVLGKSLSRREFVGELLLEQMLDVYLRDVIEGSKETGTVEEEPPRWETLETTGVAGEPGSTVTTRETTETSVEVKKDSVKANGVKERVYTKNTPHYK